MLINIFKKPEILNKEVHKDLTLAPYKNYKFTQDAYLAPISLQELSVASKNMITVFVKDESSYLPAVILGGEEKGNILLDDEYNFKKGTYIPATLRCYPFGLGSSNNNDKFIMLDSDAEVCKENSTNKIFDQDLNFTESGKMAIEFVQNVYGDLDKTKQIITNSEIEKYKILKPINLSLEIDGETTKIDKGIYIVDENSLNKLESRKIKKLATSGILKYLYLQINSLTNKY